jgi:uncharacterized protein Smg (DUF494 family)
MKETLIEVLMDIFNQILQDDSLSTNDASKLLQKLEEIGGEIPITSTSSSNLSSEQKKLIGRYFENFSNSSSPRILTEQEKAKIGTEGWGFLLTLESSNVIPAWVRELIMYEINAQEKERIHLEELKILIYQVMKKIINKDEHLELLEHLLFYNNEQLSIH